MSSQHILPDGICIGPYRIDSCLGMGGFGISYLAEDRMEGKRVVLKENFPHSRQACGGFRMGSAAVYPGGAVDARFESSGHRQSASVV